MIEKTIAEIERLLAENRACSPEDRAELNELLRQLRQEAAALPRSSQTSIADDASVLDRLNGSVAGFEATHPQLVGIANRISTILANMGI